MILQTLLYPDDQICTELDLYFQLDGPGAFNEDDRSIHAAKFSKIAFDTYFNVFNVAKWDADCALDGLFLELECEGRFEIRVIHATHPHTEEVLYREIAQFEAGQGKRIDLSQYKDAPELGVIHLELRAWSDAARFISGAFVTEAEPNEDLSLAICITTFKREREVRNTAQRLETFLSEMAQGDKMHVFIVDNGQSAAVAQTPHVTSMENPNYGGAGGFTRGLIEARARGFSHCLFMDDDATFHMENLRRSYAYLALAKDPRTAISGAMISNADKSVMFEYGAVFDGFCRPLLSGSDLTDPEVVRRLEFATRGKPHPNLYAGWWFFAFPIQQVERFPFPFFVRGDDSNFSLENDFLIKRLNGVVAFQDDFFEKETPQVHYLDCRYHLVHRLVIDKVAVTSPLPMIKVVARLVLRNIARFHYESAEAQLLAFEDVMKGPAFFRDNLDMSQRRADIKALMREEIWRDIENPVVHSLPRKTEFEPSFAASALRKKKIYAYTLNATLLPLVRKCKEMRLSVQRRGLLDAIWGARAIHIISVDETQEYVVRMNRKRAFALLGRFLKLSLAFRRDFDRIKSAYRADYDEITSEGFWRSKLISDAVSE